MQALHPAALVLHDELPASHGGAASASAARLSIRKIDHARGSKVGTKHDIEQSALLAAIYRRHAQQRLGKLAIFADDAHAAGPFGDEKPTVRKKSEAPRMVEPLGNRLKLDNALSDLRGCFGDLGGGGRSCGKEGEDEES